LPLTSFTACRKNVDYLSYLSENRSNVFVASGDNYSLKIYAVDKEYPYCADGFVGEVTSRIEVYFTVKNGGLPCNITIKNEDINGEMSYDSVDGSYYFSSPADFSTYSSVNLAIVHGSDSFDISAPSVKTAETLSPTQIISKLCDASPDTFTALSADGDFAGEIYLRLIYESAPYYYVGVVGRDKKTTAFLLDAVSGEVLATKQN